LLGTKKPRNHGPHERDKRITIYDSRFAVIGEREIRVCRSEAVIEPA